MAFDKTHNPYWFIDDTPENIAQEMKKEGIKPSDVIAFGPSETSGQLIVIIRRPSSG